MSGETIWLASYPKSGNTWLRAVYTGWLKQDAPRLNELAGRLIASARQPFDDALGVASSDLTHEEIDVLRPRVDELLAADVAGPILRKCHDAFFDGPAGEPVLLVAATRSAIYMIRDPRDVAVSVAHHYGRPVEWGARYVSDPSAVMGTPRRALVDQLRQRLGTWSEHVRSWVDAAPFPVHVLRYEDCIAEPVSAFGEALRAVGIDASDEARIAAAVEQADFDRLRAEEDRDGFSEKPPDAQRFFRRGRAGGWKDELPGDLAAAVRDEHLEIMDRFGYR
jgi:aryl sulfotransferase